MNRWSLLGIAVLALLFVTGVGLVAWSARPLFEGSTPHDALTRPFACEERSPAPAQAPRDLTLVSAHAR